METEILTVELPTDLLNELREYTSGNVHDSIVKAVQMYVARFPDPGLEERLKAGYLANAEADAALAEEWLLLGQEAWERYVPPYEGGESAEDTERD